METASPSGKFCNPIPSAKATAAVRLAEENPAGSCPEGGHRPGKNGG